ncbi:MAG: OmpH family outer membrane protein [Flavobacteriales bacterium]|jgi:Skp family chaperone for outer membrane proteins|nr:OmpH family outer membrane protein [Flavobacteriales bacterium]
MRVFGIIVLGLIVWTSCKQTPKVAYADSQLLFESFTLTEELTTQLEAKKMASKISLDSLKIELVELKKKIEEVEVPTEEAIKKHQLLYNELVTKEKAFNEAHERLAEQYDEQIMKQLNGYIKAYSEEQELDLLLGAGNGNLLYAKNGMDVTPALITYSNTKYKGK